VANFKTAAGSLTVFLVLTGYVLHVLDHLPGGRGAGRAAARGCKGGSARRARDPRNRQI